jgi:Protein of unknown function (DUF1573)
MKSRCIVVCLSVLCLLMGGVLLYFGTRAPAVAAFGPDSTEFDFGQVGQFEKVRTTFRLNNTLSGPVTIVRILNSCSCSETSVDKEVVGPGDSALLTIVFNTGGRQGQTQQDIPFVISYGGNHEHQLSVRIKATVVPDIESDTAEIVVDTKVPSKQTIRIHPLRSPDARLEEAFSNQPRLKVSPNKQDNTVTVSYDPGKERLDEEMTGYLFVTTKKSNDPCLRIPIRFVGTGG